jgi:2-amino-4-hydroxy-6-hydroxymethyldihydropteridine diphosphokinase
MILVALGSNRAGPWGNPHNTVTRALSELDRWPLKLVAASALRETAPFGKINQANFINAVALIDTHLPPEALMRRLHAIEHAAGRRRAIRWGPRTLDLDLLDYHGLTRRQRGSLQKALVLPHPGIPDRLFVLEPLHEVAPRWIHPRLKRRAAVMIRKLYGLNGG